MGDLGKIKLLVKSLHIVMIDVPVPNQESKQLC